MNREIKNLIKELTSEGWTVEYGKHIKLRSPDGGMVSCSATPSCPFVIKKIKADINRLKRRKGEKQ